MSIEQYSTDQFIATLSQHLRHDVLPAEAVRLELLNLLADTDHTCADEVCFWQALLSLTIRSRAVAILKKHAPLLKKSVWLADNLTEVLPTTSSPELNQRVWDESIRLDHHLTRVVITAIQSWEEHRSPVTNLSTAINFCNERWTKYPRSDIYQWDVQQIIRGVVSCHQASLILNTIGQLKKQFEVIFYVKTSPDPHTSSQHIIMGITPYGAARTLSEEKALGLVEQWYEGTHDPEIAYWHHYNQRIQPFLTSNATYDLREFSAFTNHMDYMRWALRQHFWLQGYR